ncbi:hypothetical protein B0T24DRAFT_676963 [Lasiosphaeria ovina]|uniref:Uncharacterized protein n=1 Tax=Lasiosphaeria ovina TaxID=92902 RepID=A0AAE0KGI4_9PEZI|nr:hypothetical protein B0T24DRAFT_676963 [Lasiosphaeria ovina]
MKLPHNITSQILGVCTLLASCALATATTPSPTTVYATEYATGPVSAVETQYRGRCAVVWSMTSTSVTSHLFFAPYTEYTFIYTRTITTLEPTAMPTAWPATLNETVLSSKTANETWLYQNGDTSSSWYTLFTNTVPYQTVRETFPACYTLL